MFCFYVEVGEEWGRVEDINHGSTVWAAPVPLPCSRRLYLPCVIPQRLYAAWCRQVGQEDSKTKKPRKTMKIRRGPKMQYILLFFGQHRTIPALRLKHRSGSCGTASALPKCSIMSGCGTRIVLRGKSPSHSATAAPASVRCIRHWRRSPLQHPVLSALLAWHLPHLACRIGT